MTVRCLRWLAMTTGPSPIDRAVRLRVAARTVLDRFGVDLDQAVRPANSASNEVWLAEGIVLRMGRGDDGSLRRESALAAVLPEEVGYPNVLGFGVEAGHEWMVTERLLGSNLAEAWPALDATTRRRAIGDLWQRLEALRRADVEHARALGFTSTPFYALSLESATELLDSVTGPGSPISRSIKAQLEDILEGAFAAMDQVPVTLVHTDAGPHNTVWSGASSIPVDFEFACIAPIDLELESLFRTLSAQPGPDVSYHLAELADELISLPGARERLRGYALLRDLWVLRTWLGADPRRWRPPAAGDHPWRLWEVLQLHGHPRGANWLARLRRWDAR